VKRFLDSTMLALATAPRPVRFFFRDDDGGWSDRELQRLVELFARHEMPLDIAMIPTATTPALAEWLRPRIGLLLGVHQHGHAHHNHETKGRKCELGPSRNAPQQFDDIKRGLELLSALFGAALDPIFTPPWNRCSLTAARALPELGFSMLSRDITADPLAVSSGLCELPVSVDWQKYRCGAEPDVTALAGALATQIKQSDTVGIMLHHARMVDADFELLDQLLVSLQSHARAECLPMRAFLPCVAKESAA
jgi:hypothetical protein